MRAEIDRFVSTAKADVPHVLGREKGFLDETVRTLVALIYQIRY